MNKHAVPMILPQRPPKKRRQLAKTLWTSLRAKPKQRPIWSRRRSHVFCGRLSHQPQEGLHSSWIPSISSQRGRFPLWFFVSLDIFMVIPWPALACGVLAVLVRWALIPWATLWWIRQLTQLFAWLGHTCPQTLFVKLIKKETLHCN